MERKESLMPNGIPRYVRVYDYGDTSADRYTVVFTGRYRKNKRRDQFVYIGMSESPFHPQGIGQHGASDTLIDKPGYSHLGKRITFETLPKDCQLCALNTYRSIWGLE